MNCCIDCFRDIEIRAIIKSFGKLGDCDFCSTKNVFICDTNTTPNPVADMMLSLLETYIVSTSDDACYLRESLYYDWDVFSITIDQIQALLLALCKPFYNNEDLFIKKVCITSITDTDFLDQFCIVKGHSWKEFSDSIKYGNRFHNDMFCTAAFELFLQAMSKHYLTGTVFYRARISPDKNGIVKSDMKAPPVEKRIAGRINPEGIPVLYLSSDETTALHEIRATTFDYITIGEMKLLDDVEIVNLSGISKASPFLFQGELEKYAANRKIFKEISTELAKPLRRTDSPLEYLPTQYIAEFIKSQCYAGVEYESTLREGGFNLAVFDESMFECTDVKTIEISEIIYNTESVVF